MKNIALAAIAITTITLTGCSKNELMNNKFESKLYPDKKVVANANKVNENVCKLEDKQVVKSARSEEKEEKKYYIKEVEVTVTHYAISECGRLPSDPDYGRTASGKMAVIGETIALPKEYPFGTVVEINGVRYRCDDRGGLIKNGRVDILVHSEKEAREKGKYKATMKIIQWGDNKTYHN